MKVPSFGAKSRRDTGRTANTQKIAKARSLNTISAAGGGSSFNTRKPARGANGKITQQASDVFKMYGPNQNVVVANSSSPGPSTRQSKTVKNSQNQFNNSSRPARG